MDNGSLLRLVITSLTLVCILAKVEGVVFFLVNGFPVSNTTCFQVSSSQSQVYSVRCKYLTGSDAPLLTELHGEQELQLRTTQTKYNGFDVVLYMPPLNTRGKHVYKCKESSGSFIEATVSFSAPCDTATPHSASSHSVRPPTSPTGNGGQNSSNFTGLNPLIYTISAVILLGTLAIVSIITCWIRARRSFNNRVLRANNTPQDYLDYISDNEFTPLTTSEFVASLQERPPTYHESEQIEQEARNENTENIDSTTNDESTTATHTNSTVVGNSLPPHPNRPLPPIPTVSLEVHSRARGSNGNTTVHNTTPSDHSPVTNILDTDAGSETHVVTTSQSVSRSENDIVSPTIAVGTLIEVEVEHSSISSPETISSPTVPVDDMLSLTPEQIGTALLETENVNIGRSS